jgi:hypothetical protein
MQQLRLSLPTPQVDRIEAVYACAVAHGWTYEPRSNGRKARCHLPGTCWYLRANWHRTTLYRQVGTGAIALRVLPTDALGEVALALERVAVQEQGRANRRFLLHERVEF